MELKNLLGFFFQYMLQLAPFSLEKFSKIEHLAY